MRIFQALLRRSLLLGFVFLLVAGSGAAAATGSWQPPLVPMTVTRHFEPPPTPYAAGHRGVDLAGVPGETVVAAGAGEVSYAGLLAGRGVVVVVHGALRTTYEPVQATVKRGARVAKGEPLGTLQTGHAGCPVAACLHWGLLRGNAYLDPLSLLGGQRIRLLSPAGTVHLTPAAAFGRGPPVVTLAAVHAPVLAPRVTWSVAALAGAGVVMIRRRR
ncbi:MAG TPA: M23 family metallopeptidase [Frankiaceae bacterium]|nr:M23 family metallopeptidase [Frankiaceae bacterium]